MSFKIFAISVVVSFCAACFPTSSFDTCSDGQRLAIVGGEEGCFDTCADGCANGTSCSDGVCVATSLLTPKPPPDMAFTDEGSVTGLTDAEANQLCEDAADVVFGCSNNHCTLDEPIQDAWDGLRATFVNGTDTEASCAQTALNTESFVEQLQQIIDLQCDGTRFLRCGSFGLADSCDCDSPTSTADPCTEDTECVTGDFASFCFLDPDVVPLGYCTNECPNSEPENLDSYFVSNESWCGENNLCGVARDDPEREGERVGYCYRPCSSQDDCQENSECRVAGVEEVEENFIRVCLFSSGCIEGPMGCPGRCSDDICELPCGNQFETYCVNSGGTCVLDDARAQEFCVLP